ncbi:cytochrome P450 [Actinomadura sp. 9N407]|uniref:cytochrome P450 n=1 Tax=Actinomadura sp. 9N407 TaxID=3375154 RepID=UPI0037972C3F
MIVPPVPDPAEPETAGTAQPPPQCPAHAFHGDDGLVNLFSPDVVADPMPAYERLRARHGPVAPVLLADDLPAWLVLGHRENLEVARTTTRFTRDSRIWNLYVEDRVPADSPLRPTTQWGPIMRFTDGDEHRRLRSAFNDSLGGLNRRGVRRHVMQIANRLIDGFCAEGKADLIPRFAQHLPILVMARLLGMPDEAGPALVKATQDIVTGAKTAVESSEQIMRTLTQVVAGKRNAPGNDLTSWLLGHSAGLSDGEVVQNLRPTLIIANETTVSLIASTIRMMLTDPRFRAYLAGGHMTMADAVEQILWDEPPFRLVPGRWAIADTQLGGQQIKAGDLLLLGLAAGNRDPAIRPDLSASLFGNRSHLAFGGGSHECPGQELSRSIVETGLDTLFARLPDLGLGVPDDELHWDTAWMTRRLASLPVTFAPRPPSAVVPPAEAGAGERGRIRETDDSVAGGKTGGVPYTAHRPAVEARSATWWTVLRRRLRRHRG